MLKKFIIEFQYLIYTLFIRLYGLGIRIAALSNRKARTLLEGRQVLMQSAASSSKTILVHCASVGEFEQALPLINYYLQKKVERIIVSFYSPSGYQYAAKRFPHLQIVYLPLDTPEAMRSFTRQLSPDLVVMVKYEYWLNWLRILQQQEVPVVLISAIFRKDQIFFRPYGHLFRNALRHMDQLFVQDADSQELLQGIGVTRVQVVGDTRMDRVLALSQEEFSDEQLEKFKNENALFMAGSVWLSDIPVLQELLKQTPLAMKFVLVPHEPAHFSTTWLGEDFCYYSQGADPKKRILVMDTMGRLSRSYRYADLAYVGGGFGKGLHNILEPVVYKIPVLIGPEFRKFNEARMLVEMGVAFPVKDAVSIGSALHQCTEKRATIQSQIRHFIGQSANVTERIVVFVDRLLDN